MLMRFSGRKVHLLHDQSTDQQPPRFAHLFALLCLCSALAVILVLLKDYYSNYSTEMNLRQKSILGRLIMTPLQEQSSSQRTTVDDQHQWLMKSELIGQTMRGGQQLKETRLKPLPVISGEIPAVAAQIPWWREDCGGLVDFAERLNVKRTKQQQKAKADKSEQHRLQLLKKSMVFMKLWKTGSSSVMNIILRAGEKYNASFVFPKSDVFVGNNELDQEKSLSVLGTAIKECRKGDIMALSTNGFSKGAIERMVVGDPAWVTLVRKPMDIYKALTRQLKYLQLQGLANATNPKIIRQDAAGVTNKEYFRQQLASAKDFIGLPPPRGHNVNQMIIDMGLPRQHLDNEDAVNRHVEYLATTLDLVLQAERMDESLVFLRHFMNWDVEDIVSFRHGDEVDNEEPWVPWDTYKNVEYQNWPDRYLYREFKNKMENKLSQFGVHRMDAEVSALRCLRKRAFEMCQVQELPAQEIKNDLFRPVFTNLKGLYPAILDHEQSAGIRLPDGLKTLCTNLCLPEKQHLAKLRRKQGCPVAEPLTN